MEEMIPRNPYVRVGRAALGFIVLTVFVLLPSLRLKSWFALVVARLPVWRQFEFFRVMFQIIERERARGVSS